MSSCYFWGLRSFSNRMMIPIDSRFVEIRESRLARGSNHVPPPFLIELPRHRHPIARTTSRATSMRSTAVGTCFTSRMRLPSLGDRICSAALLPSSNAVVGLMVLHSIGIGMCIGHQLRYAIITVRIRAAASQLRVGRCRTLVLKNKRGPRSYQ